MTAQPRLSPDHVAAVLRERVYGGVACLSTVLVLARHPETATAWSAVADVAVATGGLWAASVFADYVSHLAGHGREMRRGEAAAMFVASGQILQAAGLPLLLLVLAGVEVLSLPVALDAGIVVSVVELGLFALLAVRRVDIAWWKRLALVAAITGLGALVVLLKTVGH